LLLNECLFLFILVSTQSGNFCIHPPRPEDYLVTHVSNSIYIQKCIKCVINEHAFASPGYGNITSSLTRRVTPLIHVEAGWKQVHTLCHTDASCQWNHPPAVFRSWLSSWWSTVVRSTTCCVRLISGGIFMRVAKESGNFTCWFCCITYGYLSISLRVKCL